MGECYLFIYLLLILFENEKHYTLLDRIGAILDKHMGINTCPLLIWFLLLLFLPPLKLLTLIRVFVNEILSRVYFAIYCDWRSFKNLTVYHLLRHFFKKHNTQNQPKIPK